MKTGMAAVAGTAGGSTSPSRVGTASGSGSNTSLNPNNSSSKRSMSPSRHSFKRNKSVQEFNLSPEELAAEALRQEELAMASEGGGGLTSHAEKVCMCAYMRNCS
jgi:hypothetical protein